MPAFRYRGRSAGGQIVEGTVDSPDRAGAIRLIESRRCFPIQVEPATPEAVAPNAKVQGPRVAAPNGSSARPTSSAAAAPRPAPPSPVPAAPPTPGGERLSHAQRLVFTEQLSYLLSGGMTLDVALGILAKRLKQPRLQRLTQSLHQGLVDGQSFSQALRAHPRVFSPLYVSLAQSGEASGSLPAVLDRLVLHLTEVKALRDRVTQALVYPAFLALVGMALVVVFVTVMVPQLKGLFTTAANGASLPAATRALLAVHEVIVHYWPFGLVAVAAGWGAFQAWTNTSAGRLTWDRVKLSVPGFGAVVTYRFFAQFARTMATLLGNGVPLLRAVELLEDVAGNVFLRARMVEARGALVEGSSLSGALSRQNIFPELFVDMLAVGEQSGRFSETMAMIANVYERELDRRVRFASALIPPLIICVVAVLVGAVVFGILSAVFSMTALMRAGSS